MQHQVLWCAPLAAIDRILFPPPPPRSPFYNTFSTTGVTGNLNASPLLYMADGGLSINLPLYPFLTPNRKAKVIIAVDSSAAKAAPNGLSGTVTLTTPCPNEICNLNDQAGCAQSAAMHYWRAFGYGSCQLRK
jgi:hypothetical protein